MPAFSEYLSIALNAAACRLTDSTSGAMGISCCISPLIEVAIITPIRSLFAKYISLSACWSSASMFFEPASKIKTPKLHVR